MGGGSWSDDAYRARASRRKEIGSDGFDYHKTAIKMAMETGEKKKPHKTLDPKGVKLRESRDSEAHPESLAISVLLDCTGSMRKVPRLLRDKLSTLMALFIKKGYVEHPQIMYGGIGDTYFDDVPIQIGQFESDIAGETDLTNLVLEGGGGNGLAESHGLSMYFLAKHTSLDCMEKRNKRGYLFLITDEPTYKVVTKEEILEHIGDEVQADIPIEDIVKELSEKFNVFVIIPQDTANCGNKSMLEFWRDFYGQNVVLVKDPNDVPETIASLIGLAEGRVDVNDVGTDLTDMGVDHTTVKNVTTAVSVYASSAGIVKRNKAQVEGTLPVKAKKKVVRT